MGISHDLKTPLALINGYVEALADRVYSTEEERENYLSIIGDKSAELEDIICDLIELSKLDTGEWRTNLIKEDLGNLLDEIAVKYGSDSELHNIKFVYAKSVSSVVLLDKRLIIRVLDNLFSNALKATPKGGLISLSLYKEESKTVIEVKDSGEGINKDDINMIFEPFYRGSKSRTDSGHGLGLATVKTIITNHGWDIKALSPANDGAILKIFI